MSGRVRDLPVEANVYGWLPALVGWWYMSHPLRVVCELLFAPGRGWLRWGMGEYPLDHPRFDSSLTCACAPPLRRAWMALRTWDWQLMQDLRDPDR